MKNVYYVRGTKSNKIYAKLAYIDYDTARFAAETLPKIYARKYNDTINEDLYVYTCEVEGSISRLMYYFTVYKGYDYQYSGCRIYSCENFDGKLYSCIESLKDSLLYKEYVRKMLQGNKEDYVVLHDGSFGNKNDFGDNLFNFGDIMEGKFSVRVHKINVFKGNILNTNDIKALIERLEKNT